MLPAGISVSFSVMAEMQSRIGESPLLIDNIHIRFLDMDFRQIDELWNAQGVCSSYWRFYVNDRDGASLALERSTYPLPGGRAHLVPAWVRFSCRNDCRLNHFFVHFDLVGLPGNLVREVFDCPWTQAAAADVDRICQGLLRARRSGEAVDAATLCRAKAAVHLALAEWFDDLPPEQQARCRRFLLHPGPLLPAMEHIDRHLANPMCNSDLARLCHLSTDHFARKFRQHLGQTPAQYILERRIAQAAQRLVFSSQTIDQIAAETGFANRFHFSRAFGRRMGVSPAAYRRTSRI